MLSDFNHRARKHIQYFFHHTPVAAPGTKANTSYSKFLERAKIKISQLKQVRH